MSLIRRLLALILLSVGVALIGTSVWIVTYDPPATLPRADAIVVLGAGVNPETGALGRQFVSRIAKGAEMYAKGAAPTVVITGGSDHHSPQTVAATVREKAVALGIPQNALIVESASLSTLQNALFTRDLLPDVAETSFILVTHRYHQPRAWASFRWAGFSDPALVAADADVPFAISKGLLREGLAWPFNLARAAGASIADLFDLPRERYIGFLQ